MASEDEQVTIDVLTELETCIHSVPALMNVPVVFGIDPATDNLTASLPRVAVWSFTPSETQRFSDVCFMSYPVKICYHFALPSAFPNDIASIAALHDAGLYVRQAQRWIEERQTTGACAIQLDVIDDPKTELGISDTRGYAVCSFLLQTVEPRL